MDLKYLSMHLKYYPVALLQLLRENRNRKLISILAYATRHTQCLDDRDRIYALLSMEGPRIFADPIVPDYTIPLPGLCVQVYRLTRHDHKVKAHRQLCCIMKGLTLSWRQCYRVYRLLTPREKGVFLRSIIWGWLIAGLFAIDVSILNAISGPG